MIFKITIQIPRFQKSRWIRIQHFKKSQSGSTRLLKTFGAKSEGCQKCNSPFLHNFLESRLPNLLQKLLPHLIIIDFRVYSSCNPGMWTQRFQNHNPDPKFKKKHPNSRPPKKSQSGSITLLLSLYSNNYNINKLLS